MAINTYKQFLMSKSGNAYAKLVDIKETPDVGGTPEMLETTTKSDRQQTFIPGIITVSSDGLQFLANYDKADYVKLLALKDVETDFAIWFGGTEAADGTATPTGDQGKWEFKGYLTVYPTGSGVNEVQEMQISIAPTTPINPNME